MRFIQHKRRTAPAVIIVALIDVLIVMLIFLICTTTFRQQPALRLALPDSTSALKSGANENPPLFVSIEANGTLRYGIAGDVVTAEQLRGRLVVDADKMRAAGNEARLAVRADKSAPWGQMVRVMDIAKAANIRISSAYMKDSAK
ncbi:MAG TPA: biopolymer transporter ExbD [Verrucomicrobiae bacterium]